MNIFLSIIVPAYNLAPYIDATLQSIVLAVGHLSCTRAIEIICIDDGSTDRTGEILDDFAKKYSQMAESIRINIIHQENRGVSAARNLGLATATGKWIWFVDGDDLIHPESLDVISEFDLKWSDSDYLMFNYSHNPNFLNECQKFESRPFCLSDSGAITEVFREVCRVIFRRDLIGNLRFLDYKLGEDVAFSLSYRADHVHGCIVDSILYYYRVRDGSTTGVKVLSAEKTVDWIRANRIIFEKMAAIIGNGKLVWWYPSTLWNGFNGSPHVLPFNVVRPFYREYVDLLYDVNKYCPYSVNRRLAIQVLHLFPSPMLGWLLIYGQERIIQMLVKWRCRV